MEEGDGEGEEDWEEGEGGIKGKQGEAMVINISTQKWMQKQG